MNRWPRGIRHVRPLRRVALVGIGEHAGDGPMTALVAHAKEVPEAVSDDRPADAEVEVPELLELARRGQAAVLQFLRVVAAHHSAAHGGGIELTGERVATLFRHDVHRRAADLGFAEAARRDHRDFLRVPDVRDVRGHAGAAERGTDAQAVELETSLVAAASGAAEYHHAGNRLLRTAGGDHIGHQRHQVVVSPRRRQRADHVVVHDRLQPHALDVDDRRLAGDGDGLFERPDRQVGVDRGDEGPGQLDAFALDAAEPGQRERHRIGAGAKVDDAVLAGAISDGAADFLDQHRAGDFDRDTREHGPRRIPDDAGDRGLSKRRGGNQDQQDDDARCSQFQHD